MLGVAIAVVTLTEEDLVTDDAEDDPLRPPPAVDLTDAVVVDVAAVPASLDIVAICCCFLEADIVAEDPFVTLVDIILLGRDKLEGTLLCLGGSDLSLGSLDALTNLLLAPVGRLPLFSEGVAVVLELLVVVAVRDETLRAVD